MGNTSLHSRLAQALAKAGSYVPEESSPYGAKPVPPRRFAPAPDVPRISNVEDLIAENYIAPTVQGAQAVGGFVREHPAETAAGIAAGFTLPVSIPGMLGAGALGVAGRMIDKTHPLTDEKSDYGRQSSKEIAKDLLISGTVNGLAHGIFGKYPEQLGKSVYIQPEEQIVKGPVISGVPTRPATDVGGIEGYHIADYDLIPGANKLAARLESEGMKRFVEAHPRMELPEGSMVGNEEWMHHPETPEGKIYAERMASRSPDQADVLYSGVDRSYDPQAVTLIGKDGVEPDYKGFLEFFPDANGNPILTKWLSDFKMTGQSYGHPQLRPSGYKQAIREHLDAGTLPNPPEFAKDDPDWIRSWLDSKGYNENRGRQVLTGDYRLEPTTQEFIPFFQNPEVHEMNGAIYKDLETQMDEIEAAKEAGRDAVIYRNQRDFGGNDYGYLSPSESSLAASAHDVYATVDPGKLKYRNNYGLLDLSDYRPLASIPLAAGLGAGIVANQRQE